MTTDPANQPRSIDRPPPTDADLTGVVAAVTTAKATAKLAAQTLPSDEHEALAGPGHHPHRPAPSLPVARSPPRRRCPPSHETASPR